MKYLPIHKAMIPFIRSGMVLINKKRWYVSELTVTKATCKTNCSTRAVVVCGKDAQVLDTADMLQMYMSVNDIRQLHAFGSDKFIAKYSDYCVTNPHADNLPTHAELKSKVDAPPPLKYLPINRILMPYLKEGMNVLFSGGTLTGENRLITSMTMPCEMKSNHRYGIEAGNTGFVYSQEWFADNVYVCVDDIKKMYRGDEYVDAYKAYQVSNLAHTGPTFHKMQAATLEVRCNKLLASLPKQRTKEANVPVQSLGLLNRLLNLLATHGNVQFKTLPHQVKAKLIADHEEQLAQLLKAEENKHQFKATPPRQEGEWVAMKRQTAVTYHGVIKAESEAGLKAKLALRLAEYPNEEYNIFCQVGVAKTKPATPEIIFTNVGE